MCAYSFGQHSSRRKKMQKPVYLSAVEDWTVYSNAHPTPLTKPANHQVNVY